MPCPPDTDPSMRRGHVPVQVSALCSLALALSLSACGQPAAPLTAQNPAGTPGPAAQGRAPDASLSVPQEALANRPDTIVLPGQVEVPGYTGGIIQVDVFPAGTDTTGRGPLTTLRLSQPGPFKLLLPPTAPLLEVRAQLDLKSDGPDWRDPFVSYAGNPLRLNQRPAELKLIIDLNNTLPPPPGQEDSNERPPWETGAAAAGTQGASLPSATPAAPKPSSAPSSQHAAQ